MRCAYRAAIAAALSWRSEHEAASSHGSVCERAFLRECLLRARVPRTVLVPAFGLVLEQYQPAHMGARAHAFISAQVARPGGGLRPHAAAAGPARLRVVRWTQQITPTDTPQPMPAEFFHGGKPGRTKACIGDDDRARPLANDGLELAQKARMRAGRGRLLGAVHLLEQAQAAPMQGQAGADQLHTAIGLEIAPIDQDHWLLAVRKYLPGHASVDVCTLALQCRVAQQAIHALDALAHAGAPVQGAGQVR